MLALVTSAMAAGSDPDLRVLRRELPDARVVVWDDPTVDWSVFEAVVIRSTWDYHERLAEYLDWARRTAAVTALWNRLELIEWNTDKRYLRDLEARDIPVVPTRFVGVADGPGDLSGDVVVKPTVGGSASGAARFVDDPHDASIHLNALRSDGHCVMVQPYQSAIDTLGETGLVYLGGEFSHAFAKRAILGADGDVASTDPDTEDVGPAEADADALALGNRIVALLGSTAYARIDLVPTPDGPIVLEVEVTEPSLYLNCDPTAATRAASAFRSLVR